MKKSNDTLSEITLKPEDNKRLVAVCGQLDEHLKQMERYFNVHIQRRGYHFQVTGNPHALQKVTRLLTVLYEEADNSMDVSRVYSHMKNVDQETQHTRADVLTMDYTNLVLKTPHIRVKPRNPNQYHYLKKILSSGINFGIGPAGTGKTWLAVACAIAAVQSAEVERIILVRPAVEAGEHLGFLPGDLAQKIDPYLRPLYDALYEMLGADQVEKWMSKGLIELAPLAYMRGRTLNDAFIILDESQNTTREQMKMFLTRIGFGSKAVITGDMTQVDIAKTVYSGLRHAMEILQDIKGIQFTFFDTKDVLRHPLVQLIVEAYEKSEHEIKNPPAN